MSQNSRRILVTGGAGYIGSHCCVDLIEAGYDLVVVDNLVNASRESIRRVEQITKTTIEFHQVDIRDRPALEAIFDARPIDGVIHFAGLKAVGESTEIPLTYYQNNLTGTLSLLEVMQAREVRTLVFSSSATVYGEPETVPITEDAPLQAQNPYGRTKLFIEEILCDLAAAEPGWHIALLRYFNPVGAHPSGRIGEAPQGIPNNLMPYVMQVAIGRRDKLRVFGDDYPTRDGTGVRDYIHVVDLCRGHTAALERLPDHPGCRAWNLGTGRGQSVLEMVAAVSEVIGRELPYEVVGRRPGDAAEVYADPSLAKKELGWTAELDLKAMCQDSWRWQRDNPTGFASADS